MTSKNNRQHLVALDVGTSKVLCVVALTQGEEKEKKEKALRIVGMGCTSSAGIREGTVVDVEEAVTAIRRAVGEAQYTAGAGTITRVWAAIGGQTLTSCNCTGVAVLKGREVTQEDVRIASDNARVHARHEGHGREPIKLIPQGYACGDVAAVMNPIGLMGQKLEARMHAVYGSPTNAENLKRCIQRAGLELVNYEPHPWAAAKGVLTPSEAICGAAVIDLGAQTTSILVMRENIVLYTHVLPWGADLLTRDLSVVLGLPLKESEQLKVHHGSCDLSAVVPGEILDVTLPAGEQNGASAHSIGSVACSRSLLVRTLNARVRESFSLHKKLLMDSGLFDDRVQIVVLTGGGAKLPGIVEAAEAVFRKKVRIGRPIGIEGNSSVLKNPEAAVAAGLIRCADEARTQGADALQSEPTFFERIKTIFIGDY